MTTFTAISSLLLLTQVMSQQVPSPPDPAWTTDNTSTEKAQSNESFYSDWPWWWWIAAVTGAAVFVAVLVATCICCCCYIRAIDKRSRAILAERGDLTETGGLQNPTLTQVNVRRMNSSPAKRYLHNIVSVFSWGSDFDTPVYANPKEMPAAAESNSLVVPPPRPPKGGENHYLNVSPFK